MNERVCSACQARLRPEAAFCLRCGTVVPPESHPGWARLCAACGAELRDGARFCRACGVPAESAEARQPSEGRNCRSCGTDLRPGATFCRRCGQPARGGVPVPGRRLGRGSRRPLAVPLAIGAVLVVAGGWLLASHGGGNERQGPAGQGGYADLSTESTVTALDPAPATTDGLPMRPHVRLEHPDGAIADVPASAVLYSDLVDLRHVAVPDSSRRWDWDGKGWQFYSAGGLTVESDVMIEIPANGSATESVIARGYTGDWIELKSDPVTLPSGQPGRAVRIRDVPTPWLLAVAEPTNWAPPAGTDVEPEAVTLERLYWTDRAEWERRTRAALASALAPDVDETWEVSRSPAASERHFWDVRDDLGKAFVVLGAARLGSDDPPDVSMKMAPGTPPSFALYAKGLDQLAAVRNEWVTHRTTWAEEEGGLDKIIWTGSQTLDQAIETALALYAPWGIDLTRYLIQTGTIGKFDLRVLSAYGDLDFADTPLPSCNYQGTTNDPNQFGLDPASLGRRGEKLECRMRFYSWRSMQSTWVDWLKDWKLQTVVRWLPTLLATAGLVGGGVTTPFIFAAADELISRLQSASETDAPTAYLTLETASMSGTTGGLVVDAIASQVRVQGSKAALSSVKLGLAQSIYSVALLYGVSQTDWYLLKEVKALTEGTRTYCPNGKCGGGWFSFTNFEGRPEAGYDQIPPILAIALRSKPLAGYPPDGYLATETVVEAWALEFENRVNDDLHMEYSSSTARTCDFRDTLGKAMCPLPGKKWSGGIAQLPFHEVSGEWPDVVVKHAPAAQAIRISVPRTVLEQIRSDYGLSPDAALEDYRLHLRLAAGDGTSVLFAPAKPAEPLPGDDPDQVYFSVVVAGEWLGDEPYLDGLSTFPSCDGPHKMLEDRILRTKLHAELRAQEEGAEDDPRAEATIDFNAKPVRIEVLGDETDAERVQFLDVALEPTSDLITYSGTTSDGSRISLVVDSKHSRWRLMQWKTSDWDCNCGDNCFYQGSGSEQGRVALTGGDWDRALALGDLQPGDTRDPGILNMLWHSGGPIIGNELRFDAPPAAISASPEYDALIDSPENWYGTSRFGSLDATGNTISGRLMIPSSLLMTDGHPLCPGTFVTYTVTKHK